VNVVPGVGDRDDQIAQDAPGSWAERRLGVGAVAADSAAVSPTRSVSSAAVDARVGDDSFGVRPDFYGLASRGFLVTNRWTKEPHDEALTIVHEFRGKDSNPRFLDQNQTC
jgi:hypothetical protein